uniref:Uncharacterized protein n=1 Tax=Daphnia galeata TaxID=27404 RepID=A0A8J2RLC2_9CRUS|nr:unnamed protein product [Daphnia galeata]
MSKEQVCSFLDKSTRNPLEMASNYNEEDVEEQQTIPDDNSTYNQLWQDALDIDEEVQRILQEHSMPINDDELENAEEAQEDDDGMQ